MTHDELLSVRARYERHLLTDIIPFWVRHGVDREHGGYLTGLDRDGSVIETDKAVWFQGRFAWLLASLGRVFGPNDERLELAKHGLDFIEKHCFDADGRMFFRVDKTGRPVIKRKRYVFSECFAIMAMAAYASASGDRSYIGKARDLLALVERYRSTEGLLEPKFNPETRASRGFALPMILLAVAQELRSADPGSAAEYTTMIDGYIAELRVFLCPEHRAVLEQVGIDGELLDHFEGRLLNPGHAIEGAWFVLREAEYRDADATLIALGTTMLDWMWEWGWDAEYGGITYYRDVLGKPATEYWHDMKFWWPQCEAIIASLRAYLLTGNEKYAEMFRACDDWAHARFPDPEFGEWYGYLHRDGRLSTPVKGTMFKGPFHVPRMYLECIGVIDATTNVTRVP